MKSALSAMLLAAWLAGCGHLPDGQGLRTYVNPVIGTEFADPAVLHAPDGWFYAYATQGSRAAGTLNIQAARSMDLVRWQPLGDTLPEKPRWSRTKQKFWAPHVLHDGRSEERRVGKECRL